MKIIVAFSGGKDSLASLIWAIEKWGKQNITVVFCDTNWEAKETEEFIPEIIKKMGVEFLVLRSKKYSGMEDLIKKKGRAPSSQVRFCTQELKTIPMIDYLLGLDDSFLVIQGIRKHESEERSKMSQKCYFFKYYKEPYGFDKDGKPKYQTYRRKEVLEFIQCHFDWIYRPIFDWESQDVVNFIKWYGYDLNPLYSQGHSRVGCYPCIMSSLNDIKQIARRNPERIERVSKLEIETNSSFFSQDKIPKRARKTIIKGHKVASIGDVVNYIEEKNATGEIFPQEATSCMSFYGLCE